jgi:hypothetical protein
METGDVWIDNDIVKLIYHGVAQTEYGDDGLELLLINKTDNKPLLIDSQQTCISAKIVPDLSNTIVSPGSACVITLSLYCMTGQPIFIEDVPITGSLKINSSGFSTGRRKGGPAAGRLIPAYYFIRSAGLFSEHRPAPPDQRLDD